jgi:hypothetical protein
MKYNPKDNRAEMAKILGRKSNFAAANNSEK